MKRARFLLLLLLFGSFCPQDDCGEYRWDYKILIDPKSWQLLDNKAKPRTIHSLVRLQRPQKLGRRRTPYEKWKVSITAWVVMLGKEDDRDYHLVLTNERGTDSLIAEIPDSACSKLEHFPALRDIYGTARAFVAATIREPTRQIQELEEPVKVRISGILFFDKLGHGKGHARNGIEIHPITSITLAE